MLVNFKKHIATHFPFLNGKKILVAISGGIDSVILSHLLQHSNFDISLAHCNFRLRGNESDEDQLFVENLSKHIKVPFYTTEFETSTYANQHSLSTQMAARKLRYDWFEKIRVENNLDYIVTAHHLDDNLETFLINFTRGTGLNGLIGIPTINGSIIRPLLPFSRDEIAQYANEHTIAWREDQSNFETTYQRNKIRLEIIPLLKELNPQLLNSFKKTNAYLNGSQSIIDDTVDDLSQTIISDQQENIKKIQLQKIKELNNPKAYLFELLKGYGFTEWDDVVELLKAQSGKKIYSETHRLIKDRDHFLLEPHSTQGSIASFLIQKGQDSLTLGDSTLHLVESLTPNFEETKNTIRVDADLLQFPLEVRKWKEGDSFYPFGMTGKKKISKFFKDEKLSLIDKEKVWLLCSKNEIIWVVNRRLDDRFKVTNDTKNTLLIEYIEN